MGKKEKVLKGEGLLRQCSESDVYYKGVGEYSIEDIDKDIMDIKAWFDSWEELRKRIKELEDDEKEEAFERHERNKVS